MATTRDRRARSVTNIGAPRMRDRARERGGDARGTDAERVALMLGWFGIAVGVTAVAAPRLVARVIGVRPSRTTDRLLRLVGGRELASGIGLVRRPGSATWTWLRVAGDVMDLTLLGSAFTARRTRQGRVATMTAAVTGVTALDVWCSQSLGRDGAARGGVPTRTAITINRSADELYRFWRDFTNLPRFIPRLESVELIGERRSHWTVRTPAGVTVEWNSEVTDDRPGDRIGWRSLPGSPVAHTGLVRFERAPGGRGTQVTVEMEYAPPGGAVTAKLARLIGQAPEQQMAESLRRFKQLMETGEIPVAVA